MEVLFLQLKFHLAIILAEIFLKIMLRVKNFGKRNVLKKPEHVQQHVIFIFQMVLIKLLFVQTYQK